MVRDGTEEDSYNLMDMHLKSAQIVQPHKQIGGTLVRTKPGLWSLMCSSEAAMSISFTPDNKVNKRNNILGSIQILEHI